MYENIPSDLCAQRNVLAQILSEVAQTQGKVRWTYENTNTSFFIKAFRIISRYRQGRDQRQTVYNCADVFDIYMQYFKS